MRILLICLISLLVVGCDEREEKLNKKHSIPLAEITCDKLPALYDTCGQYSRFGRVENCRSRYTLKLFQCYGSKAAGF